MHMKPAFCTIIMVMMLIFSVNSPIYAQDRTQKVKAVFLFKFTGYITWPDKGNATTICTYGGNPFGGLLEKLADFQKKSISIKHLNFGQTISGCHIVYVVPSLSAPDTDGQAVLTVSEKRGFAKNGGMIELEETPQRIKLIVNLNTLYGSNLKASSRLLDIAELIR